jgi:hypothetical protein
MVCMKMAEEATVRQAPLPSYNIVGSAAHQFISSSAQQLSLLRMTLFPLLKIDFYYQVVESSLHHPPRFFQARRTLNLPYDQQTRAANAVQLRS